MSDIAARHLLHYVIEKSYTCDKAMEALNLYDSERTGRSYNDVAFINSMVRCGTKEAFRLAQKATINETERSDEHSKSEEI